MKVLVTGGSGFIGSRLVRRLCDAGHEVRVITRKEGSAQTLRDASVEYIQADLLDSNFPLEQAAAGCSVVFNCVGELRDESRMEPLHVDATRRLIAACKRLANLSGQALHWVQLSSVGAYGPNRCGASSVRVVTEDSDPAPVGTYEITKTRADELVVTAAETGVFSYSILRPSNVYGSGMPNDSLRQWGRMIRKGYFCYVGAPGAISTYVHVDDVVAALVLCGFDERARGHVFNISNDCPQEDLVASMAQALNVNAPRLRVPEWVLRLAASLFSGVRAFPVTGRRIDSLVGRTSYPADKLASMLGFHPQHDVKVAISEVLLNDGDGRNVGF